MIEIKEKDFKLTNIIPLGEFHGNDIEPGCVLAFNGMVSNDVLTELHGKLKSAFYEKNHNDTVDSIGHSLTLLKLPMRIVVKWPGDIPDVKLTVHTGLSKELVIEPLTIKNISFEPKDSGVVILTFQVKGNPDKKTFGELYAMGKGSLINISIGQSEFKSAPDSDDTEE